MKAKRGNEAKFFLCMFLRPAVYAPNHVHQSQKDENKTTPPIENYLNSVLAWHTKSNYDPWSLKRNSKADTAEMQSFPTYKLFEEPLRNVLKEASYHLIHWGSVYGHLELFSPHNLLTLGSKVLLQVPHNLGSLIVWLEKAIHSGFH